MTDRHTGRRYKGRAWSRARRLVLDRDGWRCQRCGRHVSIGRRGGLAAEVHHLDRDRDNVNPDPARLVTLCRDCHLAEHAPPVPAAVAAWRRLVAELRGGADTTEV